MKNMKEVLLKVVKRYQDVELGKMMQVNEEITVSEERARKLLSMGLTEILKITNLRGKKNAKAKSSKK